MANGVVDRAYCLGEQPITRRKALPKARSDSYPSDCATAEGYRALSVIPKASLLVQSRTEASV
ncbi:MAG TPA: hypothetical protein VMA71_10075 [Alloacidobacterium sp.]|nr:hypothetical protein [Alloacidobacterium sp.]